MVYYFPLPYPDELFYSLIARYIDHAGDPVTRGLFYIYGKIRKTNILVPNNLKLFESNVSHLMSLSVEQIIMHHTVYPLFKTIWDERKADKLYNLMSKGRFDTNRSLWLNVSGLNLCPDCIVEDRCKYGEAYFHRSHNIPSISYCTVHGCLLKSVSADFLRTKLMAMITAESIIKGHHAILNQNISSCIQFDRFLVSLLNGESGFAVDKMGATFIDLGLARKSNSSIILSNGVSAAIKKFVKSNFPDYQLSNNFTLNVSQVLNNSQNHIDLSVYPILVYFLESKSISENDTAYNICCINKCCIHYNQKLPPLNYNFYSSESFGSAFKAECSECSMKFYGRIEGSHILIHGVSDYGHVVQNKIAERINTGESIVKISKDLGIYRGMVEKIADNWHLKKKADIDEKFTKRRSSDREQWTQGLQSSEFRSITLLKRKMLNVYSWLMKHDKDWLIEINKSYFNQRNSHRYLYYSDELDLENLKRVKDVIPKIMLDNRLIRCTFKRILKELGITTQGLTRLPRTSEFVKSNIESQLNYFCRKISVYISDFERQYQFKPSYKQVYDKFSLGHVRFRDHRNDFKTYVMEKIR